MPHSETVSVVIPAFRNQHVLDYTIATLQNQTVKAHEIIVVDDGSETPLRVPDGVILSRIDRNPEYRGSSEAKNHGAALATGHYLAFSDSDILHLPDAIESVLRHFNNLDNQRMLVNVFSLTLTKDTLDMLDFRPDNPNSVEAVLGYFGARGKLLDNLVLGLPFKAWMSPVQVPDDGYDAMCSSEQHFGVIPRAFFDEIGRYDAENFKSWGLNNQDLCVRIVRAGGKLSSNVRRALDNTLLHCFHQYNPGAQNGPVAKAEFRAKYGRNFSPQILVGG